MLTPYFATPILAAIALVVGFHLADPPFAGAGTAVLQLEVSAEKLQFFVHGDEDEEGHWVLQYSPDGELWEDLLFLDRNDDDGMQPGAEIIRGDLPGQGLGLALFRAARLENDDPAYRDFLDARARWRASGIDRYSYEVRWNWSFFSWFGKMTVIDGKVTSETISSFPEDLEPLDLLTIEGWFDKVARARANQAEIVDVSWHPEFGYPTSGYIDVSTLIADEEQGWTIESFLPLR